MFVPLGPICRGTIAVFKLSWRKCSKLFGRLASKGRRMHGIKIRMWKMRNSAF